MTCELWKTLQLTPTGKKYIGFRRGMAFGRLCFKMMLQGVAGSKIEGCSSQSGMITLRARVQSWRCEEIKVSCSSDLQQILQGNKAPRGPRPCPGSRLWSHDFPATFFLQLSKLKHCAKWKKISFSPPKISSPESELVDTAFALFQFESVPPGIFLSLKVWGIFCKSSLLTPRVLHKVGGLSLFDKYGTDWNIYRGKLLRGDSATSMMWFGASLAAQWQQFPG